MTEEQKENLKRLKVNYLQTFNTDAGKKVLEDLKSRFFWYDTTYSPEEGKTQLNEGGRRVLLTIENMMELPVEELEQKEEFDV
jgi:hypothetical protein